MAEFAIIEHIQSICKFRERGTVLGIGDDAAVIRPPSAHDLVVCVDTLVEGIHYLPGTSAEDIGYKSLAVNLSDLAAMGASPKWATLALTLSSYDHAWVTAFASGFSEAAQQWGVELIGGDTTSGAQVISVQAMGVVPKGTGISRNGARPGDAIMVTGTLGDAAAALSLLKANADCDNYLRTRLNRPTPRVAVGEQLRGSASAMIDVSDGLLQDLSHILSASGVGACVRVDEVPSSPAFKAMPALATREFQLAGGDDYELCFTLPVERVAFAQALLDEDGCGGGVIGEVLAQPGLDLIDRRGLRVALDPTGYQHF